MGSAGSLRDYVLDQAIAAGKFGPERRAHWAAQYDRDPAATEQTLAMMVAVKPEQAYPPDLFPQHRQRHGRRVAATVPAPREHVRPVPASGAAAEEITAEQVEAWSRQLFPETVAAGQRTGRVTRANDA